MCLTAGTSEKGKLKTHTERTDGEAKEKKKNTHTANKHKALCDRTPKTSVHFNGGKYSQEIGKEPMLLCVV